MHRMSRVLASVRCSLYAFDALVRCILLLRGLLAGAAEVVPGRSGARNGQFLFRISRSGPGRPGARNGQFLLRILLAGAAEVAPAGLGLQMVSFY